MKRYEVKTMTIREFMESNTDIDVYDNVCEELGIAFCPPIYLTDKGMDKFGRLLDSKIEVCEDACSATVIVDDEPNWDWEDKLQAMKEFFYAMAGYCADTDYDEWFKDE